MLLGTLYHVNTAQATGLCQSRRGGQACEVHTPNSEQSVPKAIVAEGRGRGWFFRHPAAAWCPHLPSPRWGCWLQHSTLPPPFSFVCELLMPPALPCLAPPFSPAWLLW